MQISGNNYDNQVFDNLLDNLGSDIVLKTKQTKTAAKVDMKFSENTQETFNSIMSDELKFIANELVYAANAAKIDVTQEHLKTFASMAKQQNLRGKNLERAARKFCSEISKDGFVPIGVTRVANSDELIQTARLSTITPATLPEESLSDSRTGRYLGCSKNPNTIWNSDALHEFAKKPSEKLAQFGDERIQTSKSEHEEFVKSQQDKFMQSIVDNLNPQNTLRNTIKTANVSTQAEHEFNPKLGANEMSIFGTDRDFNTIPEKTKGEQIKTDAEERANKKTASKAEWNQVKTAQKIDNVDFIFKDHEANTHENKNTRSALDSIFDGLINSVNNKQ